MGYTLLCLGLTFDRVLKNTGVAGSAVTDKATGSGCILVLAMALVPVRGMSKMKSERSQFEHGDGRRETWRAERLRARCRRSQARSDVRSVSAISPLGACNNIVSPAPSTDTLNSAKRRHK